MGKATGFMEYERRDESAAAPLTRIKHFHEFHEPLEPAERQKQGARCMDCGVPFCQYGKLIGGMASGCPLNNLIPEWNDALYRGTMEEALRRLEKTNNFPEFTARVCPAPCEAACTNHLYKEPVTIKANELAIVEFGYENGLISAVPPQIRTGKKIAVVGSGPAGLAAADQLNQRGHLVTVYERSDRIGGLLMYGIPNMKLEKQIIERRVSRMAEEGILFMPGIDVGRDIKAEKLLKEYDAVILACGASNPRDLKVPGRDAAGVRFAVDFLTQVTKSLLDTRLTDKTVSNVKGKRVVVIGGGDTGNDCVGTVVRLGCKSVLQVEMMPEPPKQRAETNPWPEWPKVQKTDYGQEEAAAVFGKDPRIYQTTVKEFHKDKNGKLTGLTLIRLSAESGADGRIQMKELQGSEFEVGADLVLIAAGFLGAETYVAQAFGIGQTERTTVKTAENSYATGIPNVFSAGDMRRGQSLVVWAIQEGRGAAKEVDQILMGYTNLS